MNDNVDQSVVNYVDVLLHHAIGRGASDIHLEPTAHHLRVRFRIDGILHDQKHIEKAIMNQVVSRLKVLARMDIAEKRLPQDGKFGISIKNRPIDLRLSTFPSLFGEKMVIRILDRAAHAMSLEQLGFSERMLSKVEELCKRPHGFFLVTGPTGSGKTTTLYAILSSLHSPTKNIITLEDPVEYSIDGVTQGPINPAIGFTFERGIRSLLRQDPDILMVGEIRDQETARVAIEAALTGHLVLSTLHTNDASSVVMRLMDMGIEAFLINASITGVLAQRLARKICSECRESVKPTALQERIFQQLNIAAVPLYAGRGCSWCDGLGYKGRIGIFELLVMTPQLRSLIVSNPIIDEITRQAYADGMISLLHDGIEKVKEGIVTLDEVMRVIC